MTGQALRFAALAVGLAVEDWATGATLALQKKDDEIEALRADLRRLVIQLHAMEGRTEHSEECQAELAALTAAHRQGDQP